MPRHHNKGSAPGGSQRQLRVGEELRHGLAELRTGQRNGLAAAFLSEAEKQALRPLPRAALP